MEQQAEWVILELMGHRVLAGRLSEVERAGTKLLRIEVPLGPPPADGTPEKFFVQDYSGSALYGVTPVTEEIARQRAQLYRPANAAALLGAGTAGNVEEEEDEDLPAIGSPAWELEREKERQAEERERVEREAATRRQPQLVVVQTPVPESRDDIPF